MKWRAEFAGMTESTWSRNNLTFDTAEEAAGYAQNLLMRWTGADMARVVVNDTPDHQEVDLNDPTIVVSYREATT